MRKIKIQIQYIQHDIDDVMIHQSGLTEEIKFLKIQIIEKQKQYIYFYIYHIEMKLNQKYMKIFFKQKL